MCFKFFLGRHFGDPKKTFEFCGPYSEMRPAYNAHIDLVMEYLSRNRFTSKRPFPLLLSYYSNVVNLENNGTSHQFIFEQVHCNAFSIT